MLKTPSGKLELAPAYITADVERLAARLERRDGGLVLVSRRHVRSNNSWMHNVPSLVTGRDRCTLLIHPDDAARAGVADGGRAVVRSKAGELVAPVEVSDEMMPGVVCLPHGWGHDKAGAQAQRGVARRGRVQQRARARRARGRALGQRGRERHPGRGGARVAGT